MLDGAVLVVCVVFGVQSQTITVHNQMRRYNVSRVTFINKMDHMDVNPFKAIEQLNSKLKIPAAAGQIPIGLESDFKGVVDIVKMEAIYNKGNNGEIVERGSVPDDLL